MVGTVGAIAGIINTGLGMIDKYVEDPKRRLAARQEYIDSLKGQVERILNEKGIKEMDALLLDFIAAVHSL